MSSQTDSSPLLCSYWFRPDGTAEKLEWQSIAQWQPGEGFLWIHLDRYSPEARQWLHRESGLSRILCDALLAEETRPRCDIVRENLLLILRGVNLNPGADPEDMVSIRLWSDGQRLISLRGPRVLAISDVEERIQSGEPLLSSGDLISLLSSRLIDRMGPVVDALQDDLDGVEESLIDKADAAARGPLSDVRRQAVALRRYVSPQRDVFARLSIEPLPWMSENNRSHLRESTDRITRHVEDLDAIRERAAVTQEELLARSQDRMNRNTYVLSLVAAVFLPLGFFTGLLGINVGGIPGTNSSIAFTVVCLALFLVGAIELLFFYFKKWF
ncbi:zinc transporter ZntB [Puniceicoccus vermicola]|uniref:Zinc transporter ZntB n=1 Tax=Puniceicoccus vermicola TaxID=388746 RepID=A0A7X1AX42_9BACT|nr:zinc transporter ZntB [Puniceicoccus vermicola]MBC2601527.1 zinc transporter ZntB [Puniceicoccus vermicola]